MAVGQTMPNLNVPIVSRLEIIKPPTKVQDDYYAFVELTDKSKVDGKFCLSTNFAQWRYNKCNYLLRG